MYVVLPVLQTIWLGIHAIVAVYDRFDRHAKRPEKVDTGRQSASKRKRRKQHRTTQPVDQKEWQGRPGRLSKTEHFEPRGLGVFDNDQYR